MESSAYISSDQELLRQIGQKLKTLRVEANWSQTELAVKTGLGRSSVAEIEKGRNFSIASFVSILRALNQLDELSFFFQKADYVLSPMEIYRLEKKKRKRGGYKKDNKENKDNKDNKEGKGGEV